VIALWAPVGCLPMVISSSLARMCPYLEARPLRVFFLEGK
jgi:hypothetical protein